MGETRNRKELSAPSRQIWLSFASWSCPVGELCQILFLSAPFTWCGDMSLVIDRTSSQVVTSNNCLFYTVISKALPFESEKLKLSRIERNNRFKSQWRIVGKYLNAVMTNTLWNLSFFTCRLKVTVFFFFYCRCSSGPLDGSKYIQGQSQCQCFFFLFCRIQTQLTCRFWVSLAELATDCWINKNVLEFTQPRNIYMTFSDLEQKWSYFLTSVYLAVVCCD